MPEREIRRGEHADAVPRDHCSQRGLVRRPAGRADDDVDAALGEQRQILRHGVGEREVDGDVDRPEVAVANAALGIAGVSRSPAIAGAVLRRQRLDELAHAPVADEQQRSIYASPAGAGSGAKNVVVQPASAAADRLRGSRT